MAYLTLLLKYNLYNLIGHDSFIIPGVNTTKYGQHSLAYSASKLWNSFTASLGISPTIQSFKTAISGLNFDCYSLCN